MALHNDTGVIGEEAAAAFLREKGYKILENNWHAGHLEVDIIAQKKDWVAFVEVKTRTSTYGDKQPEEYVDKDKQAKIARAANIYIGKHGCQLKARFDIIAVLLNAETQKAENINHIEEAFYPPTRTIGTYKPQKKRRTL